MTKSKHKPLEASTENDFSDGAVLSVTTSENSSEHILCVTCAYTFTKKKGKSIKESFFFWKFDFTECIKKSEQLGKRH